jgi:Leucine-rich repeat (LRR) protein
LAKYGLIDLKKKYAIDLSQLKNLSKLKKLYFETSQIRDLEPISKLENLEVLILENIAVSDLNSLKRLRNLKSLGIENCENITKKQVDDLQRALPNLEISYGE